ncbi:MAG TPA: hypothetical protein VMA54_13935 [Steroidobacteraceae bacterium]|nr:hypothetical protein [Steroidobacteraceae bacterium]
MDPRTVTPYLITALIVWALYRRMRRSFGRQRVQEKRMWFRVGILTLVAVLIGATIARDVDLLGVLAAGVVCGAALAYVGLRYTKFETTTQGRFYTPHAYIGLVIAALFVGRFLYRFLGVYDGTTPPAAAGQSVVAMYQHSPFLLVAFGAVVGYYVPYYLGVLQRTKPPATLGPESGASGAGGQ